jgi:hypothetical protein
MLHRRHRAYGVTSWSIQVQHYASLEGEQLRLYRTISIVGLVLAAVILVEKIITFLYKEFRKPGPGGKLYITAEGWRNLEGFFVDLLIQVTRDRRWAIRLACDYPQLHHMPIMSARIALCLLPPPGCNLGIHVL